MLKWGRLVPVALVGAYACGSDASGPLEIPVEGPCRTPDWPGLVDFGDVSPGRRYSRRLELGSFDCPVRSLEWVRGASPAFHVSESSDAVTVEFASRAPVEAVAVLEVHFDGVPPVRVGVRAQNFPDHVHLQPDTLTFRYQPSCLPRDREASIFNFSDVDVTLTSRPTTEGPFEALLKDEDLPLRIPPGATARVGVRSRADRIGRGSGALVLELEGRGWTRSFRQELEARVELPPTVTDEFQTLAASKTDILLVIDDGPNMVARQDDLRRNIEALARYIEGAWLDVRVAVATTSSSSAGRLQSAGGQTFVSVDTPDFESQLLALASVGTDGEGPSTGLASALAVLDEEGWSPRFLREDAHLSLLFITNREDASPGRVVGYAEDLFRVKDAQPRYFTRASSISGPFEGCSGPGGEAEASPRYDEMVRLSAGEFQSICSETWIRPSVPVQPFYRRSRYFLTNQPIESTLEVRIEGEMLPALDGAGRTQWTYDFASNSINLAPHLIIAPGSSIAVEYQAECL